MAVIAVTKETRGGKPGSRPRPRPSRSWPRPASRSSCRPGRGSRPRIPTPTTRPPGAKLAKTAQGRPEGRRRPVQGARARSRRDRRPEAGAIVAAALNPHMDKDSAGRPGRGGATRPGHGVHPAHHPRPGRWTCCPRQANLAGYRAVIEAAEAYGRALPMMMTAAGTVAAAKVFIMGVGVAGLQAIATARRLGAVVTATDVRPATKEQVESAGRQVPGRRGRGVQERPDRRRLRQGDVDGIPGQAGRAGLRAHRQAGHRHHHGPDPRPPGPAPGHAPTRWRSMKAGSVHGRPGRRSRAATSRAPSWARWRSPPTASRSWASPTWPAASPPTPRRSTPATCSPCRACS